MSIWTILLCKSLSDKLRKLLCLPRFQFRFNFFNWLYWSLRLHTLLYNEKIFFFFRLFYVNKKHFTFFYWKLFVFYVVKACPWNFGTTLETIMQQILDDIHLDNYIGNIFIQIMHLCKKLVLSNFKSYFIS